MKRKGDGTTLELMLPSDLPENQLDEDGLNLRISGLDKPPGGGQAMAQGLTIGTIAGFDDSGVPLIVAPSTGSENSMKALSTVVLDRTAIGRSVAIQFEASDPHRPIILGVIQEPADAMRPVTDVGPEVPEKRLNVELDGERLILTADKEIVLRCGKSSITLTRAGKVLIRGAYLLSRSSGANRIKGGSVQIN